MFANELAVSFKFINNERALGKFDKSKFAWLAARSYPDANTEMLELVVRWLCFTFFLDDQISTASTLPDELRNIFSQWMSRVQSTDGSSNQKGPLFELLGETWELTSTPSVEWTYRFIEDIAHYLEANAWETANKLSDAYPTLEEYLHYRQYSVAAYLFFDLIEITQSLQLPTDVPELPLLCRMANNLIAWFNDIISLEKELPEGERHNLVLVISREYNCSLQEAMDIAVEMNNTEMSKFLALEQRLRTDDRYRFGYDDLWSYIDGLKYWIRANIDWSYESGRYQPETSNPSEILISYFNTN
jgi:5-epi-alpha-selinene synthase